MEPEKSKAMLDQVHLATVSLLLVNISSYRLYD
jgi:hypothetical protein